MALTKEQLALRGEIGASDVPTIVNGSPEQLLAKWRQLVGLDPPPDFTDDWLVQHGSYMEPFMLDWHQRKLGYELEMRGVVMRHPRLDFLTCTLDAFDRPRNAVIDSKCTSWSSQWALQFYTPQLLIQRECAGADDAIMLLSTAGQEPVELEIIFDQDYYDEVIARVAAFKVCMETMTPPVQLPKLVAPELWRTIDLNVVTMDNWRDEMLTQLDTWSDTRAAAQLHEEAADAAKELVPPDAGKIIYRDITIKRNKKGHLSIRSNDND